MTNAPAATSPPLTDDAVRRLVDAFDAASLPQAEWTHAAHITVATAHVFRDPAQALDRLRAGIRRLNAAHGLVETSTRGYHETLTRFYTWAVAREVRAAPAGLGLGALATRVVEALTDRNVPLRHYSRERLMSPAARAGWVEPDLAPLD